MIKNYNEWRNQMNTFKEFIAKIENLRHQEKLEDIFNWIMKEYPQLEQRIAWNQPMFTDHNTFIIGFSTAKNHIAITPEKAGIEYFSNEIKAAGYDQSMMLFKIKWDDEINYDLLKMMIDYNIKDKANCQTFWRK